MALIWRRVVGLQFPSIQLFCTVHAIIDAHGHHCIWCFLALLIIALSIAYQFVVKRTPSLINSLNCWCCCLSQSVEEVSSSCSFPHHALPLLWLPPDNSRSETEHDMLTLDKAPRHSPALSWQRWLPAVPRATIHCFGPQRSSRILSIAAKSRKSKKTGIVIQCNNVRNLLVTNQISRLSIYVFSCIIK